ncbi:MAG: FAD-dependent oxidoreductase, partial [Chitinophagaceae bacterium]
MLDYIIVGGGLAGLCFAEQVIASGQSVLIVDDGRLSTSSTAAGVYNPVILKRYSVLSQAMEQ